MIKRTPEDEQMHLAIMEISPTKTGVLPSPRSLGNSIKRFQKRVVGGKYLIKGERDKGGYPWFVEQADNVGVSSASSVSAIGLSLTREESEENTNSHISLLPKTDTPDAADTPDLPLNREFKTYFPTDTPDTPTKIKPPSSSLLVKGPDFKANYVRSTEIPDSATEYHEGGEWRPIPDHWRKGVKS